MFATIQTTSTVQCVTINAAFLQEVKEAHSQVWETLYTLRVIAQQATVTDAEIHLWVSKLTEFRRQLSTEFALEETYGYISSTQRQHINVGVDPSVTLKQHRELYLQMLEVCERVEESQYVGTVVRDFRLHVACFQEFDASLSEHERLESLMIREGLGLKQLTV
ncbi:MAG: hypothetical protein U0930_18920 [Pirellulales bacterium]